MPYTTGRLIFPGGEKEAKPFFKEMKKLQRNWAADMRVNNKRKRVSANTWFDIADATIDLLIGTDTATVMGFIVGLEHGSNEAYELAVKAANIMESYGCAFYQPGAEATRTPSTFFEESQEYMRQQGPSW